MLPVKVSHQKGFRIKRFFFLQIFRALRVPITSRMLSEILSRLIETVAEQGEDMQVGNLLGTDSKDL